MSYVNLREPIFPGTVLVTMSMVIMITKQHERPEHASTKDTFTVPTHKFLLSLSAHRKTQYNREMRHAHFLTQDGRFVWCFYPIKRFYELFEIVE